MNISALEFRGAVYHASRPLLGGPLAAPLSLTHYFWPDRRPVSVLSHQVQQLPGVKPWGAFPCSSTPWAAGLYVTAACAPLKAFASLWSRQGDGAGGGCRAGLKWRGCVLGSLERN